MSAQHRPMALAAGGEALRTSPHQRIDGAQGQEMASTTLAEQLDLLKPQLVIEVELAFDGLLPFINPAFVPDAYHQQARQDSESFLAYVANPDDARVRAYGQRQCAEGMPVEAIFRLYSAINDFCRIALSPASFEQVRALVAAYCAAWNEGYAHGRATQDARREIGPGHPAPDLESPSQRMQWLGMATDISRVVSSILNLEELLQRSADVLCRNSRADVVSISLIDDADGWAAVQIRSGAVTLLTKPPVARVKPGDDSPLAKCLLTGEPVMAFSGRGDLPTPDVPGLSSACSVMALPLVSHGQTIGAVTFSSQASVAFTTDDQARMRLAVDQLANAVENARLYRELNSYAVALEEMVQARTFELNRNKEYLETILENSADAIISVDGEGLIRSGNRAFYDMFDYAQEEATGLPLTALALPEDYAVLGSNLTAVLEAARVMRLRLRACRKDGTPFDLEVAIAPLSEHGVTGGAVCNLRDVTEIVHAENVVKAALREKNVLLQEVHHRVKNNLQIVASLLNLQTYLVTDPTAVQALVESQNRVRAMALIHEQLYRSSDLSSVDFVEFANELVSFVRRSFEPISQNVNVSVQISAPPLSLNVAIPCGLIINELVSNAFKHAFPEGRSGTITVTMHPEPDGSRFRLAVRDDGVGFRTPDDSPARPSLGLQLTHSLTSQLGGTFEIQSAPGDTRLSVTFPLV